MGSDDTHCSQTKRRWPIVALFGITLAGLALRLTNVGESLWLDELHTGWVVKDAWSDVAWRAQIGNQSPVWFYAVKVVTALGGESELTLRFLSLLAGTALMPVAYWLIQVFTANINNGVRRACGLAGLLAASLVAVDPNCIFYATEARPYACLQLCAAIQLGLFWQILQQPTTRLRIGWMLLSALAFHLHYTGILILLGELVVLVGYYLLARKPVPYRPWRALFDWQIAVMLCLPAISHVLEVSRRRAMWDSMTEKPEWSELITTFPLYSAIAVGLLACGLAVAQRMRANPQAQWTTLAVIGLWLCVPLLAAFSAAHFDLARMFLRRYLIAVAIGPMLLTALLLSRLPRPSGQWVIAAAVLGFAVYESSIIPQLRYDGRTIASRGEDWRGAIASLKTEYDNTGGTITAYGGLIEQHRDVELEILLETSPESDRWKTYLLFPIHSLYELPEQKASGDHVKWILSREKIADWQLHWEGIGFTRIQERSFGKVKVIAWKPVRRAPSAATPP